MFQGHRHHGNLLRLAVVVLAICLPGARVAYPQTSSAATFGEVITLTGGTPSDVVLDESRGVLYLVNKTTSMVYVLNYSTNKIVGSIAVNSSPLAAAMSMDNAYLYVTCSGSSTLQVIDLSTRTVEQTVLLSSAPQGVAVGSDGKALISLNGTVVSSVPTGTLMVYDRTQTGTAQLQSVSQPELPSTPASLPTTTLSKPVTTFTSKLARTPDGNYIVGVVTPTNSSTYLFVYEVASGIVLRDRTVSGASSVITVSSDGSKFMTGMSMMDITTLQVLAVENNANATFPLTSAFNTSQNVGGSVFSPDGGTLYAAFNTAATTTPALATQASTLLINDPTNLAIRLGINLPESIVDKIVMTSDGADGWGLSDSGILHLPLGKLYTYPILAPETNTVFLAMDDCHRGVATGTLKINNAGAGTLTYSISSTSNAALVYDQSSGLAPSSITFTMEPGRTGLTRYGGTNLFSGGTGVSTVSGTPFTVTLASSNAINIPPSIRVYMNYRTSGQRGVIFPVTTTRNISSSGANTSLSTTVGNEGLQDILLDEARNRLYITNSGLNRIEVFDTVNQVFLDPIAVGQLPHQMALASDAKTLYVGNTGGESISIVDLDLKEVTNSVTFPAIPRSGTTSVIYPRTLAYGYYGPEFVMSSGTSWYVSNNVAAPRATSSLIAQTLSGSPNYNMIATAGMDHIITMSGDGHVYLYDATSDAYVANRYLATSSSTTIQGYYGPLAAGPSGAYYLVNGEALTSTLVTEAGSFVPSTAGSIVTTRNVAAVAPLNDHQYLRVTMPIRTAITSTTTDDSRPLLELVDLTAGTDNLIAPLAEQPWLTALSTTRYNMTARNMVVNSAGDTAYILTLSGLTVVPLTTSSSSTQPIITSIVNTTDGSTNITPGSFITITGTNLASTATASTVPAPTVLGGSCVTFGDSAASLLTTSSTKITAQVPTTVLSGTQIVEVRSLAMAQDSDPTALTLKAASSSSSK